MMKDDVKVLGLMSGTSLDGLDLCLVRFHWSGGWSFNIEKTETSAYPEEWVTKLSVAHKKSDEEIENLNQELGTFMAHAVADFLRGEAKVDLIASHGHTIKHLPEQGITLQVGDAQTIHSAMGIPVVHDFRSQDVALGGQGAPLVPVGDEYLFSEYDYCVNLGGFSNYSTRQNGVRVASDICPVNVVLNKLANRLGMEFDWGGDWARCGQVNLGVLERLNALEYYNLSAPKSLGREWVDQNIWPILMDDSSSVEDKLRTFTEHVACQISREVKSGRVLATGGGVFNRFLFERIRALSTAHWELPSKELINFKEAMIFAFLGLLRWRGENNVFASVTGAQYDHSAGKITSRG